MAKTFATLSWACAAGADHTEAHLLVLTALTAAGIATLNAPLGEAVDAPDTSAVVFRYDSGAQLSQAVTNLKLLAISFVLTTSQVGNTKAVSADIDKIQLEKVTG